MADELKVDSALGEPELFVNSDDESDNEPSEPCPDSEQKELIKS